MPLLVGGAVAATLVLLPMSHLVLRATERGGDGVVSTLWRPRTLELVGRSVGLAVIVTALCLVIGVAAAWLVVRTDLPGRRVWQVVLGLPLALPSYVAAWSWLGLDADLAGRRGAVIVLVTTSYPYVYLPVLAALRRADPGLEEVARSLGRRPLAVFLTVTLRQVRVAATGGGLLVGLYALSDFGAVSIMRYEVLTTVIYRSYRASFDRTPAAVLGCVLVAITLVVVALEARVRRGERHDRVGGGTARAASRVRLGWAAVPATLGLVALVGAALGVPAQRMLFWLQRGTSRAELDEVFEAARSSLLVAGVGAAATLVVALPVGILSARYAGRLSRLVTSAAYAGHALPGIVVALSMVFFGIRVVPSLYQRLPVLILAYVVLFLSLAIGAVHASVAQVSPHLDEVARTLGRTQLQAWRQVTMRLASPGIGAGAALVFLVVVKELPATLLLRPTGMDTLAVGVWRQTSAAQFAAAAPYAAAIVLLSSIPTALLTSLGRRR